MLAPESYSIAEGVLSILPNLFDEYTNIVSGSNSQLAAIAQELREKKNVILPFEPQLVLQDKTLAAVDGGRATEQLSGGDLIVVGATIADGLKSLPLYSLEPFSESYATILPHVSANDNFAGRLMSALELRVLEQAKSEYLIIDGAYVNNASEILYGLLTGSDTLRRKLLDLNEDGLLERAITRILDPLHTDNPQRIVAIPKSDSSFIYSKKYLASIDGHENIPDRIFATKVLEPSEFLEPRSLATNPALVSSWNKHFSHIKDKEVLDFLKGKKELFESLGGLNDVTVDGHMFATYFKPSTWDRIDRAIKLEFYSESVNKEDVNEIAKELVTRIDDDIDGNTIMEPISQFNVDLLAKDVSKGIDIARDALLARTRDTYEAQGLLRGYRT